MFAWIQTTGLLAPRDGRAIEIGRENAERVMPSRVRCLRLHQRHLFGCWICFGIENYPYGLLTMVVSLEAIFLSTFVLISHARIACSEAIFGSSHFALLTVHSPLSRDGPMEAVARGPR